MEQASRLPHLGTASAGCSQLRPITKQSLHWCTCFQQWQTHGKLVTGLAASVLFGTLHKCVFIICSFLFHLSSNNHIIYMYLFSPSPVMYFTGILRSLVLSFYPSLVFILWHNVSSSHLSCQFVVKFSSLSHCI